LLHIKKCSTRQEAVAFFLSGHSKSAACKAGAF
jgi:hypothetical protein